MNSIVKTILISFIGILVANATYAIDVPSVREEANTIVQEQIAPSIEVQALQNGSAITEEDTSGAVIIRTIRYIGLDSSKEIATTDLRFMGNAEPDSSITISFPDDNVSEIVEVDTTGAWEITVPTHVLKSQRQFAYIQTAVEGIESDPYPVAELVIDADEALSDATWLYLFTTLVVVVVLLIAITYQLGKHLKANQATTLQNPPQS